MVTKVPAQTLIHVNWFPMEINIPNPPNTELTVLEGPVPSTLKRTSNPEKVFLNTFLSLLELESLTYYYCYCSD